MLPPLAAPMRTAMAGSAAEHEYWATTGLRGATHGDGTAEPNNGAVRLVAEPINRN
jgi:hypothetical protein